MVGTTPRKIIVRCFIPDKLVNGATPRLDTFVSCLVQETLQVVGAVRQNRIVQCLICDKMQLFVINRLT